MSKTYSTTKRPKGSKVKCCTDDYVKLSWLFVTKTSRLKSIENVGLFPL